MKKIVAFGASSSKKSINKDFATFVASQVKDVDVLVLDLNDFEMPIYSIDYENDNGIVISFAEHNGVYTAAFKNIFDWISRIEKIVWYNKPMFLLSTSDGSRGAQTVLEIAYKRISRGNPHEIPIFSLPNFYDNFDNQKGIIDKELNDSFTNSLKVFISNLG